MNFRFKMLMMRFFLAPIKKINMTNWLLFGYTYITVTVFLEQSTLALSEIGS